MVVYGVFNQIKLKPTPRCWISSRALKAKSIRLDALGDNILLESKVNTWAERMAAECAEWSIRGVRLEIWTFAPLGFGRRGGFFAFQGRQSAARKPWKSAGRYGKDAGRTVRLSD